MSPVSLQLEDLLAPTTPEAFFRESWEKAPHVIARSAQDHYAGLLSLQDVDQMIAFSRPKFSDQNAFLAAAPPRSTYVRGLLSDQPSLSPSTNPGIAELRQVFDSGKSVVIMGMHQRWPAVASMCRNLEMVFHCPVHANMYLTPAGAQGFSAHYDPHEVFILQLEGVKHWRLYERTELLPLASDKVVPPRMPLGVARDVCLKPGDLLYIPRGHVHDAHTTDTFSLHLTVGINVYRWADLLHHALAWASRRESRFRESIPGGALPGGVLAGGNAGLKQQFEKLLAALSDSAQGDRLFEEAAGSLAHQFFGQLSMLPGTQFSSSVDLDQIGPETVLEKQPQTICCVLENDEGVAIEFPGNRVSGPSRIASALRFVASTPCFAVRDLPGELNAQAKVVLARRLIREGLLTPVMQRQPTAPAECPTIQESSVPETTAAGGDVPSDKPGRTVERPALRSTRPAQQREVVES